MHPNANIPNRALDHRPVVVSPEADIVADTLTGSDTMPAAETVDGADHPPRRRATGKAADTVAGAKP